MVFLDSIMSEEKIPTIRVLGVPEHFNLPWHLAAERGYFKDASVSFHWSFRWRSFVCLRCCLTSALSLFPPITCFPVLFPSFLFR